MKAGQCFAVPVEIGSEEESFVFSTVLAGVAVDDVFLLLAAFEDVEDPVQTSLFALLGDVRADLFAVDLKCFGDHADALGRVLLDMILCAWRDQVQLEVRWVVLPLTGRSQVPMVDVVGAEIFDIGKALLEGLEGFEVAREGCSFGR